MSTTVCRACGTAFTPSGNGIGQLCLGCLLDPAPPGGPEDAEVARDHETALPPGGEPRLVGMRFAHYEVATGEDGSPVELGRGAMGVTYRATDTTLRRAVALKVVAPEIVRSASARARFLREARAAAGLRHPHVATVFFFGERAEDGQPFYAMELVEGETLQARVRRAGGLPVDTVLEIGAQVADALAAAESRGLTHRDLKPANLMLVEDRSINVKVIDFGLAKAAAEEAGGDTHLTGVEDFVGTPAFASPEHFNPWQDVDARSDFYALGATLWYALTGKTPYTGRTLAEIRDRQLHAALPMSQLGAARVPRPLAALLRSLLSPDPTGRPQTAHDLARALADCKARVAASAPGTARRAALWSAAVLGLLLAAAAGWAVLRPGRPAPVPSATAAPELEKSIAVLPFDNLSDGKDSAFFADGVQGEILTDLAKVADLKVISRGSVMQYRRDTPRDLREIAAALGVAHVLEGSVQRAGGTVRVNAQLTDARTGTQLWAEKYDRPLDDVFAIQSDIAQAITDQLRARLSAREKAAVQERPTTDLTAYDLYLRAKELFDETAYRNTEARKSEPEMVRLLDEAVSRDPKFLAPLCLLARIHEEAHWYNFDPTPAREALAEEALAEATRLQPDAGEVHLARAIHIYHQYDYAGARRELDLAARTLPNNSDIFLYRGSIYRRQGRWEDCVREYEKGIPLNPRGRYPLEQLCISELALHRFGEVARILDHLLTIDPHDAYLRADRLKVDLYSRADPQAAATGIPGLIDDGPESAEGAAGQALELALCTRDAALGARVLAATSAPELTSDMLGQDFPRAYFEGLVANLGGDTARAQKAFLQARDEMARKIAETPDNPVRLIIIGMVDAALGRKADAIAEGERCVRLLHEAGDAFLTPYCTTLLAAIYANTGQEDLAIQRLGEVVGKPGNAYYGFLRLHPLWDPLRGDGRFGALVERSAPPGLGKEPAAAPEPEKSIAVLPFENLSEEKGNAFFTNGVQDEILTDLAKVADLRVISRSSVLGYADPAKRPPTREIGRALGVSYLLEGSVQRDGARMRLSARLVDATRDQQVWADTFDRDLSDVFSIQSEVANTIAGKLQTRLSGEEKAVLDAPPTRDLAAYELYLHAKELMYNFDPNTSKWEPLHEAERLLNEATARDPDFYGAWTLLVTVQSNMLFFNVDPTPTARNTLAQKALENVRRLRPDTGDTHLAAAVYFYNTHDPEHGRPELTLARQKLSNNWRAFFVTGTTGMYDGRWDESRGALEKARVLNPRHTGTLDMLSIVCLAMRRYDDAKRVVEDAIAAGINPDYFAMRHAAIVLSETGDTSEYHTVFGRLAGQGAPSERTVIQRWDTALRDRDFDEAARVVAADPRQEFTARTNTVFPRAMLTGEIAYLRGDRAAARKDYESVRPFFEEAVRRRPEDATEWMLLAEADARLGRKEDALREAQHCVTLLPISHDAFEGPKMAVCMAWTYAATGDEPRGMAALEALENVPNAYDYGYLAKHPDFDVFRADPRFDALLQAIRKPVDMTKFNPADFPPPAVPPAP